MVKIFETTALINDCDRGVEDGGQALVFEIPSLDDELFVRIQSWDERKIHNSIRKIINAKKIKVTIEIE